MEEKKSGIGVVITILVIAIAVICAMGYYIYTTSINESTEIATLKTKLNDVQSQNDSYKDTINKITEALNENTKQEEKKEEEKKEEPVKEEIKKELDVKDTIKLLYGDVDTIEKEFAHLKIESTYDGDKTNVEIEVGENFEHEKSKNNEVPGNVKIVCDERIVDISLDAYVSPNSDDKNHDTVSVSEIRFLTENGNVYSEPWQYRYDSNEMEIWLLASDVVRFGMNGEMYKLNGEEVKITDGGVYADGE